VPAPAQPSPQPAAVPPPLFTQEARDTFTALQPDVAAQTLSSHDAQVLSDAAGEPGVLGEAEAVRSARAAEVLSPSDRAAFDALMSQARSPQEQAFIFKALGAGYALPDVKAFAQTIRGWSPARLTHTLSLADDLAVVDGVQDGVKQ